MKATRLNLALSLLLLALLGISIAVRRDVSQPNWQFLAAMKHSPAYQAFEVNTDFDNGRTLQPPVAGTIPRGDLPLHYAPTKEDAERAGEELLNPYVATLADTLQAASEEQADDAQSETATSDQPTEVTEEASIELPLSKPDSQVAMQESISRGADIFRVYCTACHGPAGLGDGPVAQRGFPPPPPLPTGNSTRMKDGQLFHILTYGQGSMSGLADVLSRDRRWDVINFVRALQVESVDEVTDNEAAVEVGIGGLPDPLLDVSPAASTDPPSVPLSNEFIPTPAEEASSRGDERNPSTVSPPEIEGSRP